MGTAEYLLAALTPLNLLLALGGVVAGTVIGALPGLTATMAVAVLVPFTFSMEPAAALIALGAIYTGAIYGGAYAAILLNTPGTPSSIATTFDGYPMARAGNGDLALTLACLASVVGGLVGAGFLLLLAPPMATVALKFGPVEYFWLAIFGLTLIASLGEGSTLKGLIGGGLGLLLSMVGVAEVGGDIRYVGDSKALLGGIDVVSALIGLYCIPVLIELVATPAAHLDAGSRVAGFRLREAGAALARSKFNLARSSIIGTVVGILPGAGGSIASLVAYSEAKRSSPRSANFGKGEPDGVIATESANNATVGGGFIPTLVLGIPGTPPDAIILGALLVQGIRTGPTLFTQQAPIVYTFIWGLILATMHHAAGGPADRPLRVPLDRRHPEGGAGAVRGAAHGAGQLRGAQQRARGAADGGARRGRLGAGAHGLQRLADRARADPRRHRRARLCAGPPDRRRARRCLGRVLRPPDLDGHHRLHRTRAAVAVVAGAPCAAGGRMAEAPPRIDRAGIVGCAAGGGARRRGGVGGTRLLRPRRGLPAHDRLAAGGAGRGLHRAGAARARRAGRAAARLGVTPHRRRAGDAGLGLSRSARWASLPAAPRRWPCCWCSPTTAAGRCATRCCMPARPVWCWRLSMSCSSMR